MPTTKLDAAFLPATGLHNGVRRTGGGELLLQPASVAVHNVEMSTMTMRSHGLPYMLVC